MEPVIPVRHPVPNANQIQSAIRAILVIICTAVASARSFPRIALKSTRMECVNCVASATTLSKAAVTPVLSGPTTYSVCNLDGPMSWILPKLLQFVGGRQDSHSGGSLSFRNVLIYHIKYY